MVSVMTDHDDPADAAGHVIGSARAAEQAIQHLCRTTLTRPCMAPAEVDTVLANLAAAAAALPQVARQLRDILEAREDHVPEVDNQTDVQDPNFVIDTARHHLKGAHPNQGCSWGLNPPGSSSDLAM